MLFKSDEDAHDFNLYGFMILKKKNRKIGTSYLSNIIQMSLSKKKKKQMSNNLKTNKLFIHRQINRPFDVQHGIQLAHLYFFNFWQILSLVFNVRYS